MIEKKILKILCLAVCVLSVILLLFSCEGNNICKEGHTEVVDKAVSPTCTDTGLTEGKHCSVCNTVTVAQEVIPANGHNEVIDKAVSPTCTDAGLTEGKHCSVCNTVTVAQEVIPANGHNEVIDKAVSPSCKAVGYTEGKHCSVCKEIIVKQEEIPTIDHTVFIDESIAATCTKGGRTQGSHCSSCRKVLEKCVDTEPLGHNIIKYDCTRCSYSKFSDPTSYFSSYGYEYLGTLEKGEAMQKFYTRLDELALNFHNNTSLNLTEPSPFHENNFLLDSVSYGDLGLTYDEAEMVMSTWDNDRPIYYWLSSNWSLNRTSGHIWLQAESEYAAGKDRLAYNNFIYGSIEEYIMSVDGLDSQYMITLGYHSKILTAIDYAYKSDGVTPMDSTWAHSILGVFDGRGVVCEGYAKTLNLLLNFSGVENIYVRGDANGGHTWNLIRLDDGEWYWCDPTWNDYTNTYGEILYTYFCVNDTQNNGLFLNTHTPYNATDERAFNRQYPLPNRSNSEFDMASVLEVYEDFVVNGYIFEVSGYKTAYYLGTVSGAVGYPPSTVFYDGIEYTVEIRN